MKVYRSKSSLALELERFRKDHSSIGFVPTMGALHQGHLSLVKKAKQENAVVVVSIYVNPTQFDNPDDLEKYPRTLQQDIELLEMAGPGLLVYAPDSNELYGEEVVARDYDFNGLDKVMEGRHRKGHFDGVGTIVSLLFEAVRPHRAYFGEKDYQQLLIIKKLVEIEGFEIDIVGCPIVRESNGLAMSSRNKRLSARQFDKASIIYKALNRARLTFDDASIDQLIAQAEKDFKAEALIDLEYFTICLADNLQEVSRKQPGNKYRVFVAAYAGTVRLIDNMALN